MKKTIVIEILLLFVVAWLIPIMIYHAENIEMYRTLISIYKENPDAFSYESTLAHTIQNLNTQIIYFVFTLLAALATLAAMILVALKDFPVFKPLLDKLAAKRADRKQANDTAKAEKAAADKQARIERLQSELDELKKDE